MHLIQSLQEYTCLKRRERLRIEDAKVLESKLVWIYADQSLVNEMAPIELLSELIQLNKPEIVNWSNLTKQTVLSY